MRRICILALLILTINGNGCKAQTLSSNTKTTQCQVKGFTSPYRLEATDIYNEIEGQVIMTLYPDSIEGAGHIVSIIASKKGWLKLDCSCFSEGTFAWVKGGNIGTATRNYNNETISLYQESAKRSKVIGELHGQQIVTILGGSNQWAYVRGIGKDGKEVEGWLEPEMQCPSPYTICP